MLSKGFRDEKQNEMLDNVRFGSGQSELTQCRFLPHAAQGQADPFRAETAPAYLSAFIPTEPPPPLAEDVYYGVPPLKNTYAWVSVTSNSKLVFPLIFE